VTRDRAGNPVRHAEAKELYSTRMFGHYNNQQNDGHHPRVE
jgi:hypothetical protein